MLIFAVAVALLGGLQLFLSRTSLGRAIRATAEDPALSASSASTRAPSMRSRRRSRWRSAAVAGAFLAMRATFDPYTGGAQLIFAFEAVVIGGFGSLWGTLLGGIVLGVAQNIGAQISPRVFLIAGHVVFLAALVARVWLGSLRSAAVAGCARHERDCSASSAGRAVGVVRDGVAARCWSLLAAVPLVVRARRHERLTTLFV